MMCLSPNINMEHPTSTTNSTHTTFDHKAEPQEWGSPRGTKRTSPDPQDYPKSLTLSSSLPRSWRRRRAVTPPLEDDDDDNDDEVAPPRRVTLDESHNVVHSIPTALACLREAVSTEDGGENATAGAKQVLWYNRDDIRAFRREAQIISQRLRQEQYQDDDDDSDSDSDDEDDEERPAKDNDQNEEEGCTRGLELRTSLQRQDRKQRIVRRILEAQEDGYSPNELAQLAGQYAVYSRQLAIAQARQDYYAVYHPNLVATATTFNAGSALCGMSSSLSPSAPSSSSSSFGRPLLRLDHQTTTIDNKKRSLCWEPTSPSITGRRVRCRMF